MSKNELGRYRKLYTRLWPHPGFMSLSDAEKVLALYLLTGPLTNRIGLYKLSIATAAEDLGTVPETLRKRLAKVCETFGWLFDGRSRVFYCPSWFRWNPPENENVMKGSLKDLNDIPVSGLIDAFARNLETVPETLRETFIEGLRQRLPKGMPIQKQEPRTVTESVQEQKPAALRATRRAGFEKHTTSTSSQSDVPAHLAKLARETLDLINPNAPLDELTDGLLDLQRRSNAGSSSRSDAMAALNVAIAEWRQTT